MRWRISRARLRARTASGRCGGSTACSARISATNEAILRAKTEQELYQRVCDAAVYSGKSLATFVLLREPDSHWLTPVAAHRTESRSDHPGALLDRSGKSLRQGHLRRGVPDAEADRRGRSRSIAPRGPPWEQANVNTGVVACVAAPLIKARQKRRRAVVLRQQILGEGRRHRRVVAAHGRKRLASRSRISSAQARRPRSPWKKSAWHACTRR